MKKVLIAEKPSVAKNIAAALSGCRRNSEGFYENSNYIVTSCVGHLLQLQDSKDYQPDMKKWELNKFPFFPQNHQFKYKVSDRTKKQYYLVKKLCERSDVDTIYICTDSDREGQLIGETVLNSFNIKGKNIKRVLVEEWTPDEVRRGIKEAVPNADMVRLRDAAYARQWMDWLLGINTTAVATLKYGGGTLLNVGRVLSPTVKLVYDRDVAIENFKPETFYKLTGEFETAKGETYTGVYRRDKEDSESERFKLKEDAEKLLNELSGVTKGIVTERNVKRTKQYPPKLYSQTTLQQNCTRRFGWTSEKVLKIAQELYEGQYITYPRTESTYLATAVADKAEKALAGVRKLFGGKAASAKFNASNKRVFDDKKVSAHSAITPTAKIPDLAKLSDDQKKVYLAIARNFTSVFMPPAEFDQTTLTTTANGLNFYTSGKTLVSEGFMVLLEGNRKEVLIPSVSKGEEVKASFDVKEGKTTPPKTMTEAELLKQMLNAGRDVKDESGELDAVLKGYTLGTSATRAGIIAKAVKSGYVSRKKTELHITKQGRDFCEVFPVKQLLDPDFTGRIEMSLKMIEDGRLSQDKFMDRIDRLVIESVDQIKGDTHTITHKEKGTVSSEPLGKCPWCGSDVVERQKLFGCTNRECGFAIWKDDRLFQAIKKKPTKTFVKSVLKNGKAPLKGCTSKAGKKYDCILKLKKEEKNGKTYVGWEFEFEKKPKNTR